MRWTPCALPHTPFIGLVVLAITHAPSGTTAQVIERVSVKSSGKQSNGFSASVALSTDGRYVAFESEATNLVASDTMTSPH